MEKVGGHSQGAASVESILGMPKPFEFSFFCPKIYRQKKGYLNGGRGDTYKGAGGILGQQNEGKLHRIEPIFVNLGPPLGANVTTCG